MDQYIGKLLDNRYEIIERIGTGGMAVVYKGRDHRLNRLVAVKILKEELAQDAELLEQRGMTAVEALEPGLLVEGERALLGRAVENLLSNAALYSQEGAEIRVTAAGRGAQVVLTVENTGARIPAEALPHLFEAFYRAEPSRSRATGGSGLGLYLVRMIVERHGGTCRIENSADGVRFTALIPRLSTENT